MKPQLKKGFTLIELMIVVAIIWVLAVTIVPALTWAQARARDAGRVAWLQNISAVLETYYSDNWFYPLSNTAVAAAWETWAAWCISNSNWTTASDLEPMFKWWKAPLNPQKTSTSWICGVANQWAYWYNALMKDWVSKAWYVLIADVESVTKANAALLWWTAITTDWTDTYEAQVKVSTNKLEWAKQPVEPAAAWWVTWWAKASVYALAN